MAEAQTMWLCRCGYLNPGRKPLVYVAGPITGDPWGCVRRATHAAAILGDLGCHAYLPQLSILHEIVAPEPYEHWIEHGLAMVERCDGILRLPGESPGADREQSHAERLGLPWHYGADDTTDLFTLFIEQVHARAAQRREQAT